MLANKPSEKAISQLMRFFLETSVPRLIQKEKEARKQKA